METEEDEACDRHEKCLLLINTKASTEISRGEPQVEKTTSTIAGTVKVQELEARELKDAQSLVPEPSKNALGDIKYI